jgi:hypothetical protein
MQIQMATQSREGCRSESKSGVRYVVAEAPHAHRVNHACHQSLLPHLFPAPVAHSTTLAQCACADSNCANAPRPWLRRLAGTATSSNDAQQASLWLVVSVPADELNKAQMVLNHMLSSKHPQQQQCAAGRPLARCQCACKAIVWQHP